MMDYYSTWCCYQSGVQTVTGIVLTGSSTGQVYVQCWWWGRRRRGDSPQLPHLCGRQQQVSNWTNLAQLLNWASIESYHPMDIYAKSKANLLTQTNNIKLNYKFHQKNIVQVPWMELAILSRFSSFKLVCWIIEYYIYSWVSPCLLFPWAHPLLLQKFSLLLPVQLL